jgi:hypothetical protein
VIDMNRPIFAKCSDRHASRRAWLGLLLSLAMSGCGAETKPNAGGGGSVDAGTIGDAAADHGEFVCPQDGVRGPGTHRLFLQGHGAEPFPDSVYPMLHEWAAGGADAQLCDDAVFVNDTNGSGSWEPGEEPKPLGPSALVHGEHFLVGAGTFVEFRAVLCDDITGNVVFYIPNWDEAGSQALHQLFVVHDGQEFLIAETIDEEAGQSGYNPFVRVLAGADPDIVPGDVLLLRSTNLNGVPFSVMVWQPPSEYESWLRVEVP